MQIAHKWEKSAPKAVSEVYQFTERYCDNAK